MSAERYHEDALRWFAQAEADLRAAVGSRQAGSHEWACFQAQQAGEKALKSFWFVHQYDPWGHSLVKLIDQYPVADVDAHVLQPLLSHARRLDKLYIPTRYPNGLPELSPFQIYDSDDAEQALTSGAVILQAVKDFL